jgi:uncharacterized protein (TIGR02996 family)
MPDHESLLAAVFEARDDAPRLVYADWLTDHGDPRGEFIQAQCRLARMAEGDPARPALERREQELLALHEAAWRAELPATAPGATVAASAPGSTCRGRTDPSLFPAARCTICTARAIPGRLRRRP